MWIDFIDSVYFTIFYPLTLIAAVLIGYNITRKVYVNKNRGWKASGVEASVIGIFALLLSFTFLSSNNSMKSRVEIMHETSDAAANLRRQSLLADDTIKAAAKEYLISYLNIMSDFKTHYLGGEEQLTKEVEFLQFPEAHRNKRSENFKTKSGHKMRL